jgi:hypothetical protein
MPALARRPPSVLVSGYVQAHRAILRIKDSWHRQPTYPDQIGGLDIYTAVIDERVRRWAPGVINDQPAARVPGKRQGW